MRRVHYLAPMTSDRLNQITGAGAYVGPQTKKVLSVVAAVRAQGTACIAVSTTVAGWPKGRARVGRERGAPVVVLPVAGRGAVKRLCALAAAAVYAARRVRRGDVVLLYNFFLEYVLCAVIARLKGARVVIDIEDGPRTDGGLRERLGQVSFAVMRAICDRRCVMASSKLDVFARGRPSLVVRGTADFYAAAPVVRFERDRVAVLLGGSITEGNGSRLFLEALNALGRRDALDRFDFLVTGHMDDPGLSFALARLQRDDDARIQVRSQLSVADYEALLATVDVGLSLKLPEAGVGQTTLPSKVIEYLSNGVLVVATRSGDLDSFLDQDTSCLLDRADADALADTLIWVAGNRQEASRRAVAGRDLAARLFSSRKVGAALTAFLFDHADRRT